MPDAVATHPPAHCPQRRCLLLSATHSVMAGEGQPSTSFWLVATQDVDGGAKPHHDGIGSWSLGVGIARGRGTPHRFVTTTSRYSRGTIIVRSSALFIRGIRACRSHVRPPCLASSRAANALSIGP